ncbi:MAG: hypothetical protein ACE5KH_06405 [Candidatus Geothermarchaeales archaeon]
MTHDVDVLHPLPLFSNHKLFSEAIRLSALLLGHAPCVRDLRKVATLDSRQGIPSTFFFKIEYACADQNRLSSTLRSFAALGLDLGLHASPESRLDQERLSLEREALSKMSGRDILGVRFHRLGFDSPRIWQHLDDIGFGYDSSFSWNELAGFRSGSAFPFRPFVWSTGKPIALLELPMAYMDWTDLHRGQDAANIIRNVGALLETVGQVNGVLVLNFHNSYLNAWTHGDVVKSYLALVGRFRALPTWLANAQQCISWWEQRRSAPVSMQQKGEARIVLNPARIPLGVWYESQSGPQITTDARIKLSD